jgi:hypothetical protein
MEQHALDEIAETAALGVGLLQVAAHETQREFLSHVISGVGIAQGAEQLAMDRWGIALNQLLRGSNRVRRLPICLVDDGPERTDATQSLIATARLFHCGLLTEKAHCTL